MPEANSILPPALDGMQVQIESTFARRDSIIILLSFYASALKASKVVKSLAYSEMHLTSA